MTPEPPIACSLDAEEHADRLQRIRAVGRDSLLSVGPDGRLQFRADLATREHLETIIAAESRCCPFLGLHLSDDKGELTLTITAPEGAEPLALALVEAFAGHAPAGGQ